MTDWPWLEKTEWMFYSACLGYNDLFFDEDRLAEAQVICQMCPVFDDCREFSLSNGLLEDDTGIYAGLLPVQRRTLSRGLRRRKEEERGIKSDV